MPDIYGKVHAEHRRRLLGKAVDAARRGEDGGFAEEVTAVLPDKDGVPKAVVDYEIGAGWMPDSAEDHPEEN